MKQKSLKQISDKLQTILNYQAAHNQEYINWFDKLKIKNVKEFYGYTDIISHSNESKLVFQLSGNTYITRCVFPSDKVSVLKTSVMTDLPLLMADDVWADADSKALIEARFKENKKIQPIPLDQVLVNEYCVLRRRKVRLDKLINFYKIKLINSIKDSYNDLNKGHILLTIGKTSYLLSKNKDRINLIEGEIIRDIIP